MLEIKEKAGLLSKIIGTQKIKEDKAYRLLTFCQTAETDGGLLIYNLLTKQLIFLNGEEKKLISDNIIYSDNEVLNTLINDWVLVPVDTDDIKLSDSLKTTVSLMAPKKNITAYTIMTTTDCNARCFYCYELGRSRVPMSDETALDIAKYIEKKSGGEKVKLAWFGGEPLYNDKVIDIICGYLKDKNIEYRSKMTSNGYLFNDGIFKRAIDLWNLKMVQITLDGTEEVYNRCKAYIYKDAASPFKIVMDNIKGLLDNGIKVNIRLNMDKHNAEDLYRLIDMLAERFNEYDSLNVYAALLFESGVPVANVRTDTARHELMLKYFDLQEYMLSKGVARVGSLAKDIKINRCMADDDGSVVVTPDGSLGKCEHFSESEFFGSIYDDKCDYQNIASWKEKREKIAECDTCPYYPECFYLKKCPDESHDCNEDDRLLLERKTHRSMLKEYEEYLKNN